MKIVTYKDMHYPIEINDVANIFAVNPKLISKILNTYPVYYIKNLHYIYKDKKFYFTRVGIIRMAMHIETVEAIDYASYLEKELVVSQIFYEKIKKSYEDIIEGQS
jgi:hypothetical protein